MVQKSGWSGWMCFEAVLVLCFWVPPRLKRYFSYDPAVFFLYKHSLFWVMSTWYWALEIALSRTKRLDQTILECWQVMKFASSFVMEALLSGASSIDVHWVVGKFNCAKFWREGERGGSKLCSIWGQSTNLRQAWVITPPVSRLFHVGGGGAVYRLIYPMTLAKSKNSHILSLASVSLT